MTLSTKAKRMIAVGVFVVAVIIFIIFRYVVEPPPPQEAVPPSVQLVESRLVGRKDGRRQWEILSQTVLQAGDVVTLSDLKEMIVYQDEEDYLTIDAPRAEWERKTEVLRLFGPVVVEGEDGFRLESDYLVWEGSRGMITSPGPVWILWHGMEITAAEMSMEPDSGLLHLRGDVEIRDQSMVWKTEEAVYNVDVEFMDFYGNVVLEGEMGND